MKKQFVPYEIALKLKELGFNEECLGLYKDEKFYYDYETFQWNSFNNCVKAPLWQQAILFCLLECEKYNQFYPSIKIFSDGSGEILDPENNTLFQFDDLEECLLNFINYLYK
jgi:hypothetical protein